MHHKFEMVKCLNCAQISISDNNMQNIGLKKTLIKSNHIKRPFYRFKNVSDVTVF